jgi:hypothetical protein
MRIEVAMSTCGPNPPNGQFYRCRFPALKRVNSCCSSEFLQYSGSGGDADGLIP